MEWCTAMKTKELLLDDTMNDLYRDMTDHSIYMKFKKKKREDKTYL